jgi:hypothetical protein
MTEGKGQGGLRDKLSLSPSSVSKDMRNSYDRICLKRLVFAVHVVCEDECTRI